MSFDEHLHDHTIGFLFCNQEEKDAKQKETLDDPRRYSLTYKPLYEMSNRYLSNGYSLLYGAELISNESAREKVIENIINIDPTVQNSISKGFLAVVNPDSIYGESGSDYRSIVNYWNSQINQIQKKSEDKTKGTMIFSTPDSYFKHDKHDIFMMFEEEIGKTLSPKTGMICWYKEGLNSLSLASLIKILITHKYTVHKDWKYKTWTANEIISMISKGIDKSLGEGSATLLFQAMNTIHKLNHEEIVVSKPVVFEGILKRLLDNDQHAALVIDSISKQIIEKIIFESEGIQYI